MAIVDKNLTQIYWQKSLSKYTTFKIGGRAECLVVTNSDDEIKKLVHLAKSEDILLWVIGNGSNLLISDQEIEGITLKLGSKYSYIKQENNLLTIGASTPLTQLVKYASLAGLSGVEFLCGIPGTFGGAVVSNAGAFSQHIGEHIKMISGIDEDGEELTLDKSELKFTYRKSQLPFGFIITKGVLELTPSATQDIKNRMAEYRKIRKERQPWGASAGSVFKNPPRKDLPQQDKQLLGNINQSLKNDQILISAGKLIDEFGLKGLSCGGAYVSKKHGNFIINRNKAKFYDVYELMQIIKCKIELETGIILEEEIQIIPKVLEIKRWQKEKLELRP